MSKFAEVLKEIRVKNGDSLRTAENKTGVVFTYIDKIEKDLRPVNKDMLDKFLKAYPESERELINAYLEDVLPESIVTKVLNDISLILKESTEKELINYLLYNSTQENRKSALELMMLQIEVEARKNGTYNNNKEEFEILKKKIEEL